MGKNVDKKWILTLKYLHDNFKGYSAITQTVLKKRIQRYEELQNTNFSRILPVNSSSLSKINKVPNNACSNCRLSKGKRKFDGKNVNCKKHKSGKSIVTFFNTS